MNDTVADAMAVVPSSLEDTTRHRAVERWQRRERADTTGRHDEVLHRSELFSRQTRERFGRQLHEPFGRRLRGLVRRLLPTKCSRPTVWWAGTTTLFQR
ncbi:MAG: hypothetical protein QM736_03565 [Vicinamibacterales bacterium]